MNHYYTIIIYTPTAKQNLIWVIKISSLREQIECIKKNLNINIISFLQMKGY